MTDTLTRDRRSEVMAAIKGKDTTPEMIVRRLLHRRGYRYALHRKDLPGSPDLVFPGRRCIVFVHGCFWHQHAARRCKARPPKSRLDYWAPKLQRNVERDKRSRRRLAHLGWRVLVVWECDTQDQVKLEAKLRLFLDTDCARMRSS